jgi:predicted nucleic acid-binding protein
VRARYRSSAASVADVQAGVLYVDTSALVKLVIHEAESDALEEELRRWSDLATSVITSIELSRAVARARCDSTALVADEYTILGVLASLAEIPLNDDVRAAASALTPVELRTLDAIPSYCQMLWMTWREDAQAATFSSVISARHSCFGPPTQE